MITIVINVIYMTIIIVGFFICFDCRKETIGGKQKTRKFSLSSRTDELLG